MSARDFPSFHNLENQTVGGWVLHERLGAGMMGAVYRGTKEGLEAAVKVYDPSIVERSREAQHRIQLQLSLKGPTIHPNLIQILDGGICPSTNLWFLVMEYHASRTLMDVLNTLPRHRIRPILAQVAGAARALERRNLAHRNINPSNILITRDYLRTTLLDFGDLAPINASFDDSDSERNLFSPNARYSPPELLTRDEQPTANGWRAVTFYQLGAVLYALIARRPLFAHIDDEPYMQLANAILREAVEVDAETRKALGDDSLIRLMQGCLQKDWSVRLESVTWQDLERIADTRRQSVDCRQASTKGLRSRPGDSTPTSLE